MRFVAHLIRYCCYCGMNIGFSITEESESSHHTTDEDSEIGICGRLRRFFTRNRSKGRKGAAKVTVIKGNKQPQICHGDDNPEKNDSAIPQPNTDALV